VHPVRVHRCTHFLARLRGGLLRGAGSRADAWCLQPCSAVHTLLQSRVIDVAFCDAGGLVLRIRPALAPGRIAFCRGACITWEFAAGQAAHWQLTPGQRLHYQGVP